MSIAKKLQTIAENEHKVFNAGEKAGVTAGRADVMSEHLQSGHRTDYLYAFYEWSGENFYPTHNLTPIDADHMFASFGHPGYVHTDVEMSLTQRLKECGVVLDTSSAYCLKCTFNDTVFNEIPTIDTRSTCGDSDFLFSHSGSLRTIEKIIVNANTKYNRWFEGCGALRHVIFEGEIAQDGLNLTGSPLLDKDSIISIVTNLSDSTSGLTVSLPIEAVDNAFGLFSDEWRELVESKPNWKIFPDAEPEQSFVAFNICATDYTTGKEIDGVSIESITDADGNSYVHGDNNCAFSNEGDYEVTLVAEDYVPKTVPYSFTRTATYSLRNTNVVTADISTTMVSKWLPVSLDAVDGWGNPVSDVTLASIKDRSDNECEIKVVGDAVYCALGVGIYAYLVTKSGYNYCIGCFEITEDMFNNGTTVEITATMVAGDETFLDTVAKINVTAVDYKDNDKEVSVTIDYLYDPEGNPCEKLNNDWVVRGPGEYRLGLSADGYVSREQRWNFTTVHIAQAAVRTIPVGTLNMYNERLWVRLNVVDSDGNPITHARIDAVECSDGSMHSAAMVNSSNSICTIPVLGCTRFLVIDRTGTYMNASETKVLTVADFRRDEPPVINVTMYKYPEGHQTGKRTRIIPDMVYEPVYNGEQFAIENAYVSKVVQTSTDRVITPDADGESYYLPTGYGYDIYVSAPGFQDVWFFLDYMEEHKYQERLELWEVMTPKPTNDVQVDVVAYDAIQQYDTFVPKIVAVYDFTGKVVEPVRTITGVKENRYNLCDGEYTFVIHQDGYPDTQVKATLTETDVRRGSFGFTAEMRKAGIINVKFDVTFWDEWKSRRVNDAHIEYIAIRSYAKDVGFRTFHVANRIDQKSDGSWDLYPGIYVVYYKAPGYAMNYQSFYDETTKSGTLTHRFFFDLYPEDEIGSVNPPKLDV